MSMSNSNYNTNDSFCKNCDNFMDITNNISEAIEIIDSEEDNNMNDSSIQPIESSDYDVSNTESIGGSNINEDNISTILDGSDTDITILKFFDINKLNKYPSFNKLSNEQKTLVINRILEKMPKQKTSKQIHNLKESYFYCKSCGYNEKIPNKKFIFSRGNENKNEIYNNNFLNLVNDNTLPTTKNYNCINSNCSTHKNPKTKSAVFYRHINSYNIRYICKICLKFWDNYSTDKNNK